MTLQRLAAIDGLSNKFQDKEALLAAADNALYRAKKMGRNRVMEAEVV